MRNTENSMPLRLPTHTQLAAGRPPPAATPVFPRLLRFANVTRAEDDGAAFQVPFLAESVN